MARVGWLVCALAASACGGAHDGSTAGAPVAGAGGMPASDVGFEATVMPLINQACNCHQTEPILMAPFSLKSGEAYDNLVSASSTELPTMALVAGGSLNDSYLWHKLNGTQLEVGGSGERMPSTIPLEPPDIEAFGRWIAAGAPP